MESQKRYFGNEMVKLTGLLSLALALVTLGLTVVIGTIISETWNLTN